MKRLLAFALLASLQAHAQTEIILDNGTAAFTIPAWLASFTASRLNSALYRFLCIAHLRYHLPTYRKCPEYRGDATSWPLTS